MSRPAVAPYPAHIRSTFERVEGAYVNHCIVTCGVCNVPRSWPRFPAAVTAKYLLQRGYLNPLDPRRCTCPQCATVPASAALIAPPQPAKPPKPKLKEKSMNAIAPRPTTPISSAVAKAVAPRLPSPEDNIKVLDALDAAYDRKLRCYSGKGSDEALAAQLDVPRAWVASVRDQFFGPDTNVHKEGPAQLAALKVKLKTVETDALAVAERAETAIRELDAHVKRLAQAGAA